MVAGGIRIAVADPGRSFLEIYSCDGRLVQDMSQQVHGLSAGSHVVPLPRLRALQGMYVVRFDNGKDVFTGMMNLGR
jgi:predicted DNA-binding protein with PD1-like motif